MLTAGMAFVSGTGVADAATVNSSGAYGNPARYAPYVAEQLYPDCVEQSALAAMSALAGKWVASHAGIDAEAYKLGVGFGGPTEPNGSSFDATNDVLFAHYGFKATSPKSTSRATVEAALGSGKAVQVTVYAGYLWPAGWDANLVPSPDHAVIVEAVNKTTGAVTVGDTGIGQSYTLPWSAFSKAWATGGYQAIIISK